MRETTMTSNATIERPGALQGRPAAVPWFTVMPLAVVMAYADGFWMVSLRGAVGAIERTQGPFASWLRESTIVLPVFVFAVLGALTLALRWFGPVLRTWRTVLATALLIVAAGTLAGIAEMAASSAYDYHLQSSQLQLMASMGDTCAGASCLAQQQQASLALQVHAVGYGAAILLVTNLVLIGWVVAIRGGRVNVSTTRPRAARTRPQPGPAGQRRDESVLHRGVGVSWRDRTPALPVAGTLAAESAHLSRVDDLRLLLAVGLLGSAAIHAAVVPEHLSKWAAAGGFFIVLAAAQLAVAALLLARRQPTVLLAAAVVSIGPLALWLYSRTLGLPFGAGAGVPEQVGLADCAVSALEVATLLVAVVLLRGGGWLRRRPPASAHLRSLTLVAVIAVTAIGFAGSGLGWFDDFGNPGGQSVMNSQH